MSLNSVKLISVSILLLLNTVSGFLSFIFASKKSNNVNLSRSVRIGFSYVNCFSIGVFVGISLLGLYNNSNTKIRLIQRDLPEHSLFKSYPLSESLLCFGLFMLCGLESLLRFVAGLFEKYWISRSAGRNSPNVYTTESNFVNANSLNSDDEFELLAESSYSSQKQHLMRTEGVIRDAPFNSKITGEFQFSFLKSVMLSYALSLHSFLEALGFGLLDTYDQAVTMVIAMALHQFVCAGTLGFRLARACVTPIKRYIAIGILVSYLSLLPLGSVAGIVFHRYSESNMTATSLITEPFTNTSVVQNSSVSSSYHSHESSIIRRLIMAVLQNLAASSFLYVVFVEMVPSEISSTHHGNNFHMRHCGSTSFNNKREKIVCYSIALFGFLLVFGVRFLHYHSHNESV